jgi:phosphoribosylanthranilate isomerase
MKYFTKICGVTELEDLKEICELKVSAIGFNRDLNSPRLVSLEFLNAAANCLNEEIYPVIVFVNESRNGVLEAAKPFKRPILQFHGDEDEKFCSSFDLPYIKAISMNESDYLNKMNSFETSFAILLDSGNKFIRGGTGETFDWKLIPKEMNSKIIIAGGLNSNNISSLLEAYQPFGIDVASGVESKPGKKDILEINKLLENINEKEKTN